MLKTVNIWSFALVGVAIRLFFYKKSITQAVRIVRLAMLVVVFEIILTSCSSLQPPAPLVVPEGLIIFLSDNSPAFVGVQREISKRYQHAIKIYSLGGDENQSAETLKKIQSSDKPTVVAIGLPAAKLARGLSNKKVIFCQVFNYEDTDLITSWMKGVDATPAVMEQFRVWKTLAPRLKKVGVIIGKNQRSLIDKAVTAARVQHIDLVHVEVKSDKETLYAYKQLAPKIQGLWLVPDNRVLSGETIRDIMAYSVKEGKQVAVFSHALLGVGGLLSAESSNADIAVQVLARIEQAGQSKEVPGKSMTALTKANIRINPVMVGRLNLSLPKSLQGLTQVP
ncbi:MAG: hypothetical protein HY081_09375 [Gammaproteobacteria bacterium]|nr:hypothetical protein [Gammaproteobacteria bacterium]